MKLNLKNFSWKSYRNKRQNSLSFFGVDRFNDWVIVLWLSVILFFLSAAYDEYLYVLTRIAYDEKVEQGEYPPELIEERAKKETLAEIEEVLSRLPLVDQSASD